MGGGVASPAPCPSGPQCHLLTCDLLTIVHTQAERMVHKEAVAHKLEVVGSSLSEFGKSLFVGTKELIEQVSPCPVACLSNCCMPEQLPPALAPQVRDAVESEIAVATKETKRGGRGAKASAAKLAPVQAKYNRFEAEVRLRYTLAHTLICPALLCFAPALHVDGREGCSCCSCCCCSCCCCSPPARCRGCNVTAAPTAMSPRTRRSMQSGCPASSWRT